MNIRDLDYHLPEELIAQTPHVQRDGARLMCIDPQGKSIEHRTVRDLPRVLFPSLIVLNDTRVIPARLLGNKPTGGRVELLLTERLSAAGNNEIWLAMGKASSRITPGTCIDVAAGQLQIRVERCFDDGMLKLHLHAEKPIEHLLAQFGLTPLPPYIKRDPDEKDVERYQTVYARELGAVAAPTAGLHFTDHLLDELSAQGHELAWITLHVGPGTFAPVRSESLSDHKMHQERCVVPEKTVEAVRRARKDGRQIVAVGTTVVRTLESRCDASGQLRAGSQKTSLFIYPPFQFRVVDALMTNFHLPRSTLLALVMAFAGAEMTRRAYRSAVALKYRFFSYGDSMLIQRSTSKKGKR